MRDYPNGGFFFIDAAPIQAAGENGLKIDGIFEDAKRAVAGGKVFVLAHVTVGTGANSGMMAGIPMTGGVTGDNFSTSATISDFTINLSISDEDYVTLEIVD